MKWEWDSLRRYFLLIEFNFATGIKLCRTILTWLAAWAIERELLIIIIIIIIISNLYSLNAVDLTWFDFVVHRLPVLGSGSDYAPFITVTGIPCIDIRYTHKYPFNVYPLYHSVYETRHLVTQYMDPQFAVRCLFPLLVCLIIVVTLLQFESNRIHVVYYLFIYYLFIYLHSNRMTAHNKTYMQDNKATSAALTGAH